MIKSLFCNIMSEKEEENVEEVADTKTQKKKFKRVEPFYQDMLGSLLIMFSNMPVSLRFHVALDLYGYVDSLLLETGARNTKTKNNKERIYSQDIEDAKSNLDLALAEYMDGGSASSGVLHLYEAVDILKQIIITRGMISEDFEFRSNPLGSASLEEDTMSKNYRNI